MARKWGDIWDLRKIWELSIIALIAAMPSLALAEAVLTSQAYVDSQDALKVDIAQGSGNAGKVLVVGNDGSVTLSSSTISSDLSGKEDVSNKLNGTSTSGQKIGDLTAGSAAGQDQVMYPSAAAVKEYAVAKHPGVGTNNANVGKALIVDSSGDLALGDVDALPAGSANQVIQYNGTNNTWDAVTMDTTPTDSSNKPVTSGGVYDAVNGKVDIAQGSANAGKGLVVDSGGDLALANILQAINSATNNLTSGDGYVVKAVTLNSDNKTIDVTRDTVKLPVSSGAPSSNTPSGFAEIWVQ